METDPTLISNQYLTQNREIKGIINTNECTIPDLKPQDPSIKKYVKNPSSAPKCSNSTATLLGSNRTTIWVRSEALHFYNASVSVTCCYQSFHRPVTAKRSINIDNRVKYGACVKFNNTVNVQHEFVRVKCSVNGKSIYKQFFLFAPMKKFHKEDEKYETINKNSYNVLIIGVDSVSRQNLLRTMPKTVNYLKTKGAVDMLGYNKVGYNTLPNLVPMLTGLKDREMHKLCNPSYKSTFDNCPFIWKRYKQAGYYTAYVEDCTNYATFNYLKRGFAGTPTDYYTRTFLHEAEYYVGKCSKLCMNDIYYYKVLLNYLEDITWSLKSKRLFGLFWENSMSHDDLNYPMRMDLDYKNMFAHLDASGYLKDTIVFFVSDHGMRWGPIRCTKQGYLEERLPFLYILTPKSFQEINKEAYDNLKLNMQRLTTPFDLYETLSDLIDVNNVNQSNISARSSESFASKRGISLFLPVPSNRTCTSAGIEDQWCTCRSELPLVKDHPKAVEAAKTIVKTINDLLKGSSQCAKLSLTDVVDVTEIQIGKTDKIKNPWREFTVVVKTAPSEAVFEATLRNHITNHRWEPVGAPSRLTKYGTQSWCTKNDALKPYCYCHSKKSYKTSSS